MHLVATMVEAIISMNSDAGHGFFIELRLLFPLVLLSISPSNNLDLSHSYTSR